MIDKLLIIHKLIESQNPAGMKKFEQKKLSNL